MIDRSPGRIVCFGEALIDLLSEKPETPQAERRFLRYAGGAPANVAVAVARLGGNAAFVGMLSSDMFGDFLLASLRGAGVDTSGVVRTGSARTALAFIALDPDGERRFNFYRPPAADLEFREKHFRPDAFAGAVVFHVCSNSLTGRGVAGATLAGVRRARRAGVLVSFDVNLRPNLWSEGTDPAPRLWRLLRRADLVKLCAAELAFLAAPLGGEKAVFARLWAGSAKLAIVTDGPRPVRCVRSDGEIRVPVLPMTAVDTTAAGDAFMGGFLFRLAEDGLDAEMLANDERRLERTVRFASACGAFAVTRRGAFAAMPGREEVRALLNEAA